jgi:hypothetical protein
MTHPSYAHKNKAGMSNVTFHLTVPGADPGFFAGRVQLQEIISCHQKYLQKSLKHFRKMGITPNFQFSNCKTEF